MTPNWMHHSKKAKKTKGMCKAQLKARRQSLKALKAKDVKYRNGADVVLPPPCYGRYGRSRARRVGGAALAGARG